MADADIDRDKGGGDDEVTDSSNLSEDEWKAVEEFMSIIESESVFDEGQPVDEETAIKFLMARKFEVHAAVNTYRNNQISYKKFKLKDLKPDEDPLAQELKSGKFTVLEGKDNNGAVVCLFTAHLHRPKVVAHNTVLQSLIFQLDEVMKGFDAQRNGLALIYDMAGAGYAQFDFDLSMKVLSLLKGGYPARLKHVYVVAAPLWFRASLVILSSFLKEKIRDRVEVLKSGEDLLEYMPKETLPRHLGGMAVVDHKGWLAKCMETFTRLHGKMKKHSKGFGKPQPKSVESSRPEINGTCPENDLNVTSSNDKNGTATILRDNETSTDEGSTVVKPTQYDSNGSRSVTTAHVEQGGTVVIESINDNPSVVITDTSKETESKGSADVRTNGFTDDTAAKGPLADQLSESDEFDDDDDDFQDDFALSFNNFIEHMRQSGKDGVHLEYRELRAMPPMGQFITTRHPVNLKKNRYSDVLSYEHSRVRLSHIDDDQFSDYINANYVDGYKQPKAYICTQGPLNNTYADFWRMVWEQNVLVIVMITKCVERGRVKCGQYWPEQQGSCIYGHLQVTLVDSNVLPDYTVRHFRIKNLQNEDSHMVTHFQFTSWPDFGVLSSPEPFHEVLEQVRLAQAMGYAKQQDERNELLNNEGNTVATIQEPPIVVHCSAGIGRTGTFCCTDINMRRMSDEGRIDIFDTVRRLREQRAFSVQTAGQYEFCHTAVIAHMMQIRREQGLDTEDLEIFLDQWYSQPSSSNK